jgi:glycosyltransferase involved in cell wall biosynthesis
VNLLTFTTLYPNGIQPEHGIFVENRLRRLVELDGVEARVLAPVPWFPVPWRAFGRYGRLAQVPRVEQRHGLQVDHPRFPAIPKLGMSLAPLLLYGAAARALARLFAAGHRFDLIDAQYFYPDGVAAALLGRRFGLPVSITGRGTDLNLIPRYALPRRMIRWAAARAACLITVSRALKQDLVEIGVDSDRIQVLRNGVDLARFRPVEREGARRRLGVEPPVVASVGHLIPRKGHDLILRALTEVPEATLLIVGEGPEGPALRRLAEGLGLAGRVRFLGQVAHDDMAQVYGAADLLALASEREGWPNVLLEAMACGTPVAATAVGGIPEIVTSPDAGRLVSERTPGAVAAAIRELIDDPPDRARTRAHGERFAWDRVAARQVALYRGVVAGSAEP